MLLQASSNATLGEESQSSCVKLKLKARLIGQLMVTDLFAQLR